MNPISVNVYVMINVNISVVSNIVQFFVIAYRMFFNSFYRCTKSNRWNENQNGLLSVPITLMMNYVILYRKSGCLTSDNTSC